MFCILNLQYLLTYCQGNALIVDMSIIAEGTNQSGKYSRSELEIISSGPRRQDSPNVLVTFIKVRLDQMANRLGTNNYGERRFEFRMKLIPF